MIKKILLLFLVVLICPIIVFAATFGDTVIRDQAGGLQADRATVLKVVLPEAGTLEQISIYCQSSTQENSKAFIYSDVSNFPTTLISSSSPVQLPSSWAWVDFSLTASLTAGTYWIGIVSAGNMDFYYTTGITGADLQHAAENAGSYANPLTTWSGGSALDEYSFSCYATYTASGAGSSPVRKKIIIIQ